MFGTIKTMASNVGNKVVDAKNSVTKTWNDASIVKKSIIGAAAVAVVVGAVFIAMDKAKLNTVSNDVDDLGSLDLDLASLDVSGIDAIGEI